MLEKTGSSGVKGILSAATNLLGGGVVSKIANGVANALGLGENNTDPEARKRAEAFKPGSITRLGAAPRSLQLGKATETAPVPGVFYLVISTGEIYESKAAGFYLITDSWAIERRTLWIQALSAGVIPAQNPAAIAKRDKWVIDRSNSTETQAKQALAFGGLNPILVVGLILGLISLKGGGGSPSQ